MTFPCLTTSHDSGDPNKPCIFPFYRNDVLHKKCFKGPTASDPFCGTRAHFDHEWKHWGNCNDDCNGETAEPGSKFNIVSQSDLWEQNFYDMRSWSAGFCHTYNPPEESGIGVKDRIAILLGNHNDKQGNQDKPR